MRHASPATSSPRRARRWATAGALAAGLVISQPASAAPAATTPPSPTSDAATGVQSAQVRLAAAEQEVRRATQQTQQLAYAVVALHNQLADAEVAVTVGRADARRAIREAYDEATVDPTESLYAALNDDPDLATRVRDRRMQEAGVRARRLQQSVSRLSSLNRDTAGRRTAANKAAAHAVGAADEARRELAAAEQTELEVRARAELAAQRRELDRLNSQLAETLAAINAASPASSASPASPASSASSASEALTADSPAELRSLYSRAAATCPGLPWGVLAGIGQVETDHGRNKAISSAGARGPMQFLPSTFAVYGVDGDGDGKADILDQADAVYSAAHYLCASGGRKSETLYDAIFAYNHSDYYVNTVLGLAAQYH